VCSTGERNGFTVLTEEEFYDFHLTTPELNIMMIRVRRGAGARPGGKSTEERGLKAWRGEQSGDYG